jgi:membrane protease subunit HflK
VKKEPLLKTINDFMLLLKGIMALVFLAYCFSGLTIVKPDEIAMVLRFGKLTGSNRISQIHKPGWLFALPKPIDTVVKIPRKQILEIQIKELITDATLSNKDATTLNPVTEGYAISGDKNIFQTSVKVKYQILDPILAVFNNQNYTSTIEKLIRALAVSELTQVAGKFTIDGLLSKNKREYALTVKANLQKNLDSLKSGVEIVAIELEEINPPPQLQDSFEEVNTAFISRKKYLNDAQSLSGEMIPKAKAQAQEMLTQAYSYREKKLANTNAEANQFLEMLAAYKKNPAQTKMDLLDATRKNLFANMKNLVVFPSTSTCDAPVRTFFTGSAGLAGPYDDIYSEDGTEQLPK